MGVKLGDLFPQHPVPAGWYHGKRIAVDGHNVAFRYLTSFRGKDGDVLRNPDGRVITIDVEDNADEARKLAVFPRRVDFLLGSSTDATGNAAFGFTAPTVPSGIVWRSRSRQWGHHAARKKIATAAAFVTASAICRPFVS